jgi:hydroxymethylbilane synthase
VTLDELPVGARVGTSSPRRAGQLLAVRPDVVFVPIRGNVPTRVARVVGGDLDAVVLAAAGLDRLRIAVPAEARLSLDTMLPAPAQGALAIQARATDTELVNLVSRVDHRPTRIAVDAERALLRRVGGGCLAPLGAFAEASDETLLRLRAAYASGPDGWRRADIRGTGKNVSGVIEAAAESLMAWGARS